LSLSQQSKRKGKTVWQSAFDLAGLHNTHWEIASQTGDDEGKGSR